MALQAAPGGVVVVIQAGPAARAGGAPSDSHEHHAIKRGAAVARANIEHATQLRARAQVNDDGVGGVGLHGAAGWAGGA